MIPSELLLWSTEVIHQPVVLPLAQVPRAWPADPEIERQWSCGTPIKRKYFEVLFRVSHSLRLKRNHDDKNSASCSNSPVAILDTGSSNREFRNNPSLESKIPVENDHKSDIDFIVATVASHLIRLHLTMPMLFFVRCFFCVAVTRALLLGRTTFVRSKIRTQAVSTAPEQYEYIKDGGFDNTCKAQIPLKIAVAGGGVGGMFTAYALQQKGFDVTLFEKASKFSRFGGPIQLASNALSCINALSPDLFDEIMTRFTFTGTRKCGIKVSERSLDSPFFQPHPTPTTPYTLRSYMTNQPSFPLLSIIFLLTYQTRMGFAIHGILSLMRLQIWQNGMICLIQV